MTPLKIRLLLITLFFLSSICFIVCCVPLQRCIEDTDGDGYGNPASSACTHSELDCDDSDPEIYPGAEELCGNQLDNDCDGIVDEECLCMPLDPNGYGECAMVLGVVFDGQSCVGISGCGCEPDCEYFFDNFENCGTVCFPLEGKGTLLTNVTN